MTIFLVVFILILINIWAYLAYNLFVFKKKYESVKNFTFNSIRIWKVDLITEDEERFLSSGKEFIRVYKKRVAQNLAASIDYIADTNNSDRDTQRALWKYDTLLSTIRDLEYLEHLEIKQGSVE